MPAMNGVWHNLQAAAGARGGLAAGLLSGCKKGQGNTEQGAAVRATSAARTASHSRVQKGCVIAR